MLGRNLNWFCFERKETPLHGKSHLEKQKFDQFRDENIYSVYGESYNPRTHMV
jgi:hypothetical protein